MNGWRHLFGGILLTLALSPIFQVAVAEPLLDYSRIHQKVLDGEFAAVEKALGRVEKRYRKGKVGDQTVGYAYGAFATTHPGFGKKLDAWVRASPESHRPRLARAVYRLDQAFLARGGRLARDTRKEQFRAMNQFMDRASADLAAALKRRPDLTVAYARKIQIAMARGSEEDVRRIAARGLKEDPASYTIRLELLQALQPKWGGSLAAMREVLREMKPHIRENPPLKELRGYIPYTFGDQLALDGRVEGAIGYFDKAIKHGSVPAYFRGRARAYLHADRYEKALEDVNRVLKMLPQSAYYFRFRGDLHRYRRQNRKALADYDEALRLDPRNPRAAYGKGRILMDREHYEEAVENFRIAAIHRPYWASVFRYWGQVLSMQLDKPEEGVQKLRKARELAPKDPEVLYQLIWAENKARDCAITDHFQAYLDLCTSGKDCEETQVNLIRRMAEQFERQGTCS